MRQSFLKKIEPILRAVLASFFCLCVAISAWAQQREEITREERALIKRVSSCGECSSPILDAFGKAYEIKNKISEETKGPSAAYTAAYNFAKAWVTASEVVATSAAAVVGVFTPSELADNDLDMDTDQPMFQPVQPPPDPPKRGLGVTGPKKVCVDSQGRVYAGDCPP